MINDQSKKIGGGEFILIRTFSKKIYHCKTDLIFLKSVTCNECYKEITIAYRTHSLAKTDELPTQMIFLRGKKRVTDLAWMNILKTVKLVSDILCNQPFH